MPRLRALTDSAVDAIVSCDGDGRVIAYNPAAAQLFGYSPDEVLGRPFHRLVSAGDDAPPVCVNGAVGTTRELSALRKDGLALPVEISVSGWQDGGDPVRTVVLRDASAHRATQQKLATLSAAVASLLEGQVLDGRYRLERLLRTDPAVVLYEGVDLEQRVPVHVGVMRSPHAAMRRRVPADHAGAVAVIEIGRSALGLAFVAFEPLSGEPLSDRLRQGPAPSLLDALRWARDVAEVVAEIHERGGVHGRLCASSVFLARGRGASAVTKLLCFELGALVPGWGTLARGESAEVQLFRATGDRGDAPDRAADVYALSVLSGLMLLGGSPRCLTDAASIRDWIAPLSEQKLGDLPALLAGGLRPEPTLRPTARELTIGFARALEAATGSPAPGDV